MTSSHSRSEEASVVHDITYCENDDCPFTDCLRHMAQLRDEHECLIISVANFGGVCRQYLSSLVGDPGGLRLDDSTYITEE